jgi:hypothetical protein
MLPHPPYSPDLALSDFFLFADLKKMLAGKKFSTNEAVIVETNYKNGSKNCMIAFIGLEGTCIE